MRSVAGCGQQQSLRWTAYRVETEVCGDGNVIKRSMRRLAMALATMLPAAALASLPLEMSLTEMATEADHVLVGYVVDVDMVDESGNSVLDEEARTGPGLNKIIRLHVAIDEPLATTAARVPKELLIPLDPLMQYSLGQVRAVHQNNAARRLLLLKSASFSSLKPGIFSCRCKRKTRYCEFMVQRTASLARCSRLVSARSGPANEPCPT